MLLIEATVLGAIGATVATAFVYLLLDGRQLSTVAATSSAFTQVVFEFDVTLHILGTGLAIAISLALLGGIIPAVKAVAIPITDGLRNA